MEYLSSFITFLMVILVVLVLIGVILFHFRDKIKILVLPNAFLVTGVPGGGKSSLNVSQVVKYYKRNVLYYRFVIKPKYFINKFIFRRAVNKPEKPMIYSNIPLNLPYVNTLTKDILYRKVRIPLNSIVFVDEISNLADSMMIKSIQMNEILRKFFKYFRHYAGNRARFITNTQAQSDSHFAIKRILGSYLWIYRKIKLPFITLLKVREFIAVDGESGTTNIVGQDIEKSTSYLWFWNSVYKKYDSRCYSVLTDDLPLQVDYKKQPRKTNLKTRSVLDLHDDYYEMLKQERKK